MKYIIVLKPRIVEAVYIHTSNLIKNKIIYKRKKSNISLPCSFYDTG